MFAWLWVLTDGLWWPPLQMSNCSGLFFLKVDGGPAYSGEGEEAEARLGTSYDALGHNPNEG